MFDHYEKEYLGTTRKAMQDIEEVDSLLPGVERDTIVKRTSAAIQAAEEIVQSMDLEARSMAGESKQQLVAQAKDYKAGIAGLKTRLKAAQASSRAEEAARAELMRGTDPTLRMEAENQRSRLMATTETLNRGTDKLRHATKVALETEAVGESILSDLADQRQTIAHARSTLAGASAGLDRSKKLLHGMGRRALKNKVLMYIILGTLAAMILFIIYFKWIYSPGAPAEVAHSCPPLPPPAPPAGAGYEAATATDHAPLAWCPPPAPPPEAR